MIILSVDPGQTLGYALAEIDGAKGQLLDVGEVKGYDRGMEWFRLQSPELVILEEYTIRPQNMFKNKYAHDWSKGETIRQIARMQESAVARGIPVVMQEPSTKPVGYGFAGLKYTPGKKGTHMQDAVAHLMFYLVKTLKLSPDCLQRQEPDAAVP